MTTALTFDSVSLHYGLHTVIEEFNVTIPDGSVTGLIGLNGAGKTTLIKSVLGLRDVSAGTVSVYGYTAGAQPAKHYLSYLPENFAPPEFLSGYEFLNFACRFYQDHVDRHTLLAYGQMLDLDDNILRRRVSTYSKGMRQKIGLIGAVLADAPCLILDEPMAGLDPAARIAVKQLLSRVHTQGKTIVLSSHILVDMDEICETLLVLAENRLQFRGAPDQLKEWTGAANLEKGFLALVGNVTA